VQPDTCGDQAPEGIGAVALKRSLRTAVSPLQPPLALQKAAATHGSPHLQHRLHFAPPRVTRHALSFGGASNSSGWSARGLGARDTCATGLRINALGLEHRIRGQRLCARTRAGRKVADFFFSPLGQGLCAAPGWPVTDGGWAVTDGGSWVTDGGWRVTSGGWPVTDGGRWVADGGQWVPDGSWWVADGHGGVLAPSSLPYGLALVCTRGLTPTVGTARLVVRQPVGVRPSDTGRVPHNTLRPPAVTGQPPCVPPHCPAVTLEQAPQGRGKGVRRSTDPRPPARRPLAHALDVETGLCTCTSPFPRDATPPPLPSGYQSMAQSLPP